MLVEVGGRIGRCSLREALDEVEAGGLEGIAEGKSVTISVVIDCKTPTMIKALLT
jgi:hypothetical protein